MSKTMLRAAAAVAVTIGLCANPDRSAAQEAETGPRRAAAQGLAPADAAPGTEPTGAAPVPEQRGPLGEPAPPAVEGLLDPIVVVAAPEPAGAELRPEAVLGPVVEDDGLLGEPADGVALGEPVGDAPLGEPVEVVLLRSFLPPVRESTGREPVSLLGTERGITGAAFLEDQLTHRRVVDAQLDAKFDLKALFAERGLTYPPRDLYFRLFKQEQVLEVWVRDAPHAQTYTLLREYPICAVPGRLGPKTRLDDFQAPEGFYYIEGFNPESDFHLSLRLNYPNAADRIIGVQDSWGGDIYIHGGCSTVGCFPMTDEAMAELYWLAVEARTAGQTTIPVHVFPARLNDPNMRWLSATFERDPRLVAFWENLREGYTFFEEQRQLPVISVDRRGRYLFTSPSQPTVPPAPGVEGPLGAEVATRPAAEPSPAAESSPAPESSLTATPIQAPDPDPATTTEPTPLGQALP